MQKSSIIAGIEVGYKTMQIIAHRGASAYAPENTLAAFNAAFALGSRFIEFDVMLSADGDPFVFHDNTLNRTTFLRGKFGLTTTDVIASCDAGSWFSERFREERIPTLTQALQWLLSHNVHANIEIKPYPNTTEQTTVAVLSHINQYWPHDKPMPLISSFDQDALLLARSLSPEMPLGFLMHEWKESGLQLARKLECVSVHLSATIATRRHIEAVKAEGFLVYVYTIDCSRFAKRLCRLGVDAVFSDYPDLLR